MSMISAKVIFLSGKNNCSPMAWFNGAQPGAQEFFNQPGPLGFREAIQTTKDGLDVVVAPNVSYAYANAGMLSPEDPRSIRLLVIASYASNYGAILLDLPSGEGAWTLQPLLVANLVLIVSRPTLEGIRATAHIARLLTENLHSNHRIPKESIFVVINQRTKNSTFTAASFHKKGADEYGWFPPVLATIDYDPFIPQAQDSPRLAINASEELGKNVAGLADTFFRNMDPGSRNGHHKERSFLGIRVRMGE
jgi:cellulose biosynthesis protein BcsQ